MTTEYERLLARMIGEKKSRLIELTGRKQDRKEIDLLTSDLGFLEVELRRYQQSMSLFRTKNLPRVGRWGKPEAQESGPAGAE